MRRAAIAIALASVGCAQAEARFPADVQTSIVSSDMRRLETPDARVYYAAPQRDEAMRVVARFEACLHAVRARAQEKSPSPNDKANIVLPPVPINNAYVQAGTLGQPPIAVVPSYATSDLFTVLNIPPDPSTIGCHEMVHYVQARQMAGLPSSLEDVFGYLVSPELGLDPWFWEGLAVYYETRLQSGVGRLASAFWRGVFAAGVAADGVSQSDLDYATRRVPFGAHYLVGSHFIDWLVAKHGEKKLWDVVARQSDEVVFPLGVSGRFTNAFGAPLGSLFSDFARDVRKEHPPRARRPEQRVLRTLDQYARLAVARDGTWAVVESGLDTPTRLVVVGPDGAVRLEKNLTELLPSRALVSPGASDASGLSFTADARELWFVMVDRGRTFQVNRLLRVDVASGRLDVVAEDLGGAGGSVAPDGSAYWFSRPHGDSWHLARYQVPSKRIEPIATWGDRTYVVQPRISPDGRRIVATFAEQNGLEARVLDAATGKILMRVPAPDVPTTEPSWVDDDTIVYLAETDGRLDVFRASLSQRRFARVTQAPFLAFAPGAARGRVVFLNREGWTWTVDDAPLAADAPVGAARVALSNADANAMRPRDEPYEIWSDEPYRATDGLFVPTLRGPSIAANGETIGLGIGLSGGDRLGFHRWGVEGSYDSTARDISGAVKYVNGQLAPMFVILDAQRDAHLADFEGGSGIRREHTGSLLASRTFWTTNVTTGFRYNDLREPPEIDPRHLQAGGALASITYDAVESTPAAGTRRAILGSFQGTYFPSLGAPAFGDTRGELDLVTPLPLSKRHTLSFAAAGRALPGLRSGDRLLEVGGFLHSPQVSSDVLQRPRALGGEIASDSLPPGLAFTEPLRGYEDMQLHGTRVVTGLLLYRMPIVFDWGAASSLTVFPSVLFRQLDVEAFGSGASLLDGSPLALAAGGALIARTKLWVVPFDIGVQVARRLTYDEGVSVIVVGTNTGD